MRFGFASRQLLSMYQYRNTLVHCMLAFSRLVIELHGKDIDYDDDESQVFIN